MSKSTSGRDAAIGGDVPENPYAVLRNRDFLLYLVGRLVASFGQQMLTVAVGWELYERTHSALALGLVGLTQMIQMMLCTLPAGHVADNYERKRIIITMISVIALKIGRASCRERVWE